MSSKLKREWKKKIQNTKDIRNAYSVHINHGLLRSSAFLSLTPSAQLILLEMVIENQIAVYKKEKDSDGRPYFQWTATESDTHLHISKRNHFNAVALLKDREFITVVQPGGLLGSNGTPNIYALAGGWSRKEFDRKRTSEKVCENLVEARKKSKAKKEAEKQQQQVITEATPMKAATPLKPKKKSVNMPTMRDLPPSTNDAPLQPGQLAYYKLPGMREALRVELKELTGEAWEVKGARKGNDSKRPILSIPVEYILTVETVRMKSGKNKVRGNYLHSTNEKSCTTGDHSVAE